MIISPDIEKLLSVLTLYRRDLHRIAELSEKEFKTQKYICGVLDGLKIKHKSYDTGVVCDISGNNHKRLIALRADMDALGIKEEGGAAYKSETEGVMHACGHDGHMAMLLAAAGYFKKNKPDYDLRLIFQPAEEGAGGAAKLIEAGALKGVDEIYALHLKPSLPIGQIAVSAGTIMAGVAEFDIDFKGAAAHCAEKEKGADAVMAGALFITGAAELMKPYQHNNLFHIGAVKGGSVRNAVADSMKLMCTLRFFDPVAREEIMQKLSGLLCDIRKKTGADSHITVTALYPPLKNGRDAVDYVKRCVPDTLDAAPEYTAEDFSEYLLQVKGCFAWLGTCDGGEVKKLHSGDFDFDERALLYGMQYYKQILINQEKQM